MTKDGFYNQLPQKEEIFQKVTKCERSGELGQRSRKNLLVSTYKIEGKSYLPTTCHFLLKKLTFFSVFQETFTT